VVIADLATSAGVQRVLSSTREIFSELDLLVNNAGGAAFGPTASASDAAISEVLAVNVQAPIMLVRELLPLLQAATSAAIVNVGSEQALRPGPENSLYGASKAALAYLTRAWAAELSANGIRVNAVLPGAVDTPLLRRFVNPDELTLPLGRTVSPSEVADWIVALADTPTTTGAMMLVDGGVSLT
jgi:NAD(P)-dependent dehydrogenase (short-subunit alcohol dehydrogenase family)